MEIIDRAISVLKFIYRPRETLERFGAFLCREKISALEENLSVAEARLVELQREADELQRECVKQTQDLDALRARFDFRAAYKLVSIGRHTAYALRIGFGPVPRLVCPVCFERGILADFAVETTCRYDAQCQAHYTAHVSCPTSGCSYRFAVASSLYTASHKFVD
jgi:hypothetical protein